MAEPSTPVPPPSSPNGPRLSDVGDYLRAPRFVAQREPLGADALVHLGRLLMLVCGGVLLLTPMVSILVEAAMSGTPRNVNEDLFDIPIGRMVLIGVVLAPLIEEALFRSWLGGPRACLLGLPALGLVLLLMLFPQGGGVSPTLSISVVLFIAFLVIWAGRIVIGANAAAVTLVRERLFGVIFWVGALMFAVIHLQNFEGGLSHPVLMLAVMPQFFVGAVLGYVRMRFGLVAAVVFHGAYNAVWLVLARVTMSGQGEAAGAGEGRPTASGTDAALALLSGLA